MNFTRTDNIRQIMWYVRYTISNWLWFQCEYQFCTVCAACLALLAFFPCIFWCTLSSGNWAKWFFDIEPHCCCVVHSSAASWWCPLKRHSDMLRRTDLKQHAIPRKKIWERREKKNQSCWRKVLNTRQRHQWNWNTDTYFSGVIYQHFYFILLGVWIKRSILLKIFLMMDEDNNLIIDF